MLTREQVQQMQERSAQMLAHAGIVLTSEEQQQIEVADLGLGEIERTGLQLVIYINNDRYCAKELIMTPRQTCAQHRHPPLGESNPGKGNKKNYVSGKREGVPEILRNHRSRPLKRSICFSTSVIACLVNRTPV